MPDTHTFQILLQVWTREAISANTERRCRRWVMRHNQPWKVLLTSELLTPCVSAAVLIVAPAAAGCKRLLASNLCARICEVFEAVGARVALELRQRAFVQVESAERYERSVENSRSRTNHPTDLSV